MTKLTSAAWLAAATIVFSGCADTSEPAGNSSKTSAAASSHAVAVQHPGNAAAAAVGEIDPATDAAVPDTPTLANPTADTDGKPPVAESLPPDGATQTGGAANPGLAVGNARVAPVGNPVLGGGSSGVDGVAAVSSKAVISAKTGVAEFTIILIDRIRRKINKKRGRPNSRSGAGFRGTPTSGGALRPPSP